MKRTVKNKVKLVAELLGVPVKSLTKCAEWLDNRTVKITNMILKIDGDQIMAIENGGDVRYVIASADGKLFLSPVGKGEYNLFTSPKSIKKPYKAVRFAEAALVKIKEVHGKAIGNLQVLPITV